MDIRLLPPFSILRIFPFVCPPRQYFVCLSTKYQAKNKNCFLPILPKHPVLLKISPLGTLKRCVDTYGFSPLKPSKTRVMEQVYTKTGAREVPLFGEIKEIFDRIVLD